MRKPFIDLKITSKSTIAVLVLSVIGIAPPAYAVAPSDASIFLGVEDYGSGDEVRCDLESATTRGTADEPFLIGTAKQLAEINDCNDGTTYKYYRQTVDIDLTPTSNGSQDGWNDTRAIDPGANVKSTGGWVPIGDFNNDSGLFVDRAFSGSYDGNKKAISGLTINRDAAGYQGLFGKTDIAEIKNLIIGSVTKVAAGSLDVSNSPDFGFCGYNKFDCGVGVVVGIADKTNFKNISVINLDISGSGFDVGGIAGNVRSSSATDVSFRGNITSSSGLFYETGGIFGSSYRGNIKRAIVEGIVTCDFENIDDLQARDWDEGKYCGGIAGRLKEATLSQAQFSGDVTASNRAGGIVGEAETATIDSAEFKGNVYGSYGIGNNLFAQKLGGIAGYFEEGVISDVVSHGDVRVDASSEGTAQSVGGIVGDSEETGIQNSVSHGDVRVDASSGGNAYLVGGIAGEAKEGGIHNVVSNSKIIIGTSSGGSANTVGGIAGDIEALSVTSSLATGNIEVKGTNSEDNQTRSIGGVAGRLWRSSILDVKVTGDLTVEDGESIGGIAGNAYLGASILRSSFSGKVHLIFHSKTGTFANVGGAIGYAETGALISSTSVTKDASVTATGPFERVGGLIGYADTGVAITDSYNRAPVLGYNKVGGIVGLANDKSVTVYNTYNTGTVTANVSAIEKDVFAAGGNFKEGLSRSNTFDTQTTNTATSGTGVVGNTTAAMKSKTTFEALGFDFSSTSPTWAIKSSINDGYPYLIEARLSTQPVVAPAPVPAEEGACTASLGKVSFAACSIKPTTGLSKSIQFSTGTSFLSKAHKTTIKKLVVASGKKVTYVVTGTAGFLPGVSEAQVKKLAMKRANIVKAYLLKLGVKKANITTNIKTTNRGIVPKTKILTRYVA